MKSTGSSVITPRPISKNGRALARGLVPELGEALELFAGVDEPPVAWFVPVGEAPGEAATVGNVLAPMVEEDVGDGKILRVAPGEGAGVVVAVVDGVLVTVGEGVLVTVGEGVLVAVGEGVLVTVGDGVVVTVGEGVVVSVGEGVLVSVGVTSSGV